MADSKALRSTKSVGTIPKVTETLTKDGSSFERKGVIVTEDEEEEKYKTWYAVFKKLIRSLFSYDTKI